MKKKLTDNQKRLILCFVIILIFIAAYQFIYTEYEDSAQDYIAKADTVKQQITQRKMDLAQEDTLTQQTADINKSIDAIIAEYPVKLMKEDNLVFIEDMERALGLDIPSVDVLDTKEFYTTVLPIRNEVGLDMIAEALPSAGTEALAGDSTSTVAGTSATADGTTTATDGTTANDTTGENTTGTSTTTGDSADQTADTQTQYMEALVCPISISFQTTEKQFLKVLDYINNNKERTSVAGVSLNYDSTSGELICNMTINRYVLIGSGKEYQEPDIGDISIGTDNLFGTGK